MVGSFTYGMLCEGMQSRYIVEYRPLRVDKSTRDRQNHIFVEPRWKLEHFSYEPRWKLTDHISDDYSPIFSPTGEKIIFASNRGILGRDLYIMNIDGTSVQQIFGKPANRQQPTVHPGGAMIAYKKRNPDGWGLYIASLRDTEEQWLAWIGGFGGMPDFAPNGTEIVFVMGVERFQGIEGVFANTQIVFINLQTHIQKVFMADNVPLMGTPAWEPSGDTIAFSWKKPGIRQESAIYIGTREGRKARRIIPLVGNPAIKQYSPVWSPRGNELIYVQSDGEAEQLFKIALDDGEPIQLTPWGQQRSRLV